MERGLTEIEREAPAQILRTQDFTNEPPAVIEVGVTGMVAKLGLGLSRPVAGVSLSKISPVAVESLMRDEW